MTNNARKFEASLSSVANKMRIKAFPASLNEQHVGKIWDILKKAILEIQKKNNSGLSFEELYRNAYTMVLQKQGEQLYNGTKQVVTEHLTRVRDQVLENINNGVLGHLNQCWKEHHTAMVMIRDVLMYLDRVFVAQTQRQGIYNTGLVIFRDVVLRHEVIKTQLQNDLLALVSSERRGEVIAKSHVRDACQMLVQLGVNGTTVYEEDFELAFLEQSREFYRQEGATLLAESTSSVVYIGRVEARLAEEARRAQHCLDPSTEPKIVAVLEEELIDRHLARIVSAPEGGLPHMLANKSHAHVAAMYRLLSRVDHGLTTMSAAVSVFLRHQGRAIVLNDHDTPLQYVSALLQLRDKANVLLAEALDNHALFRNQINADFEFFVNDNARSPEYLSLFIDDKLRRGTKGVDDPDMDIVLDKCIVLFRYLQDKDVFERYYKQHLAKRLLTMKSQSDDQEKSMIGKLIVECGGVFTSKLEGMFKDMAVSKTLMDDWRASGTVDTSLDLYVRVLTTGLWPTQSLSLNVTLPEEAKSIFAAYSKFYLEKHNGRVINLQPNLGSVELSSTFPLNVSSTTSLPMVGSSSATNTLIDEMYPIVSPSRDSSGSFGSQVSHTGGDAVTGVRTPSVNSHLAITGAGANVPSVKKYILQVIE